MKQYKAKENLSEMFKPNTGKNTRWTEKDVQRDAKRYNISADEIVNQYLDEVNENYYSVMEWKETRVPIVLLATKDLNDAKKCARDQYGDYDTVYRAYVAFADQWDAGEHVEVDTDIWDGEDPDKRWLEVYGVGLRD